jgi:hypothetical protein
MKRWTWVVLVALPLLDLAWNLTHLNIGLADFYGLTLPAYGFLTSGAWPATPYFPAGYPLLLIPFGLAGSTLVGGYILSAIGGVLALFALRRTALEFELREWLALLCAALGWLIPSYRIVAGSPSVDSLFTGIALWFIWAAVRMWRERSADHRTFAIMMFACAALPLLRYHATVLLVPVLIVILVSRRATRAAVMCVLVVLLIVGANYLSWYQAYAGWMPGVVGIQIRNGIEADYRINYATPEQIYADYPAFVERARSVPLFDDYSAAVVLKHTAKSYYYFVRRPTVAFTLLLLGAALALGRRLQPGVVVLSLWALGYTLALSPAYYTPRGALLPELAVLPLIPLIGLLLSGARLARWVVSGVVVLLLAAEWRAGRFARAMLAETVHFAQVSRQFSAYLHANGIDPVEVVVSDSRVIWLPAGVRPNPWSLPFPRTEQYWTEDPAVDRRQVAGAPIISVDELGPTPPEQVSYVLMSKSPPRDADLERISRSLNWMIVDKFGDQILFMTTRPPESSSD